ncbi:MAG: carboxypeptidase regulatory-like domain-containing protein [Armatimonadota bacterium]
MKKVRFLSFLVMLCLAIPLAAQAVNVIANPAFELSPYTIYIGTPGPGNTAWHGTAAELNAGIVNWSIAAGEGRTGYCAKAVAGPNAIGGSAVALRQMYFALSANTTYKLGFWFKNEGPGWTGATSGPANAWFELQIHYFTSMTGNGLSVQGVSPTSATLVAVPTNGTLIPGWTYYEGEFTTLTDTVMGRVKIMMFMGQGHANLDKFWLDDVSISEAAPDVIPPNGPIVTDSFNRTVDTVASLGSTDAPNAYPWKRGIYNDVIDPRVSIDGAKLQLGTGPNCWSGTFIDGLLTRDFDAKITLNVPGEPGPGLWWGAGWTGIQYRGMKPMYAEYQTGNDTAGDPAAYMLQFVSGTATGFYTAQIVSTQTGVIKSAVTSVNFATPHIVRLRVVGSRHKVWIDNILDTDAPVINVTNGNNTNPGYFEVCRRDYPTTYDNLSIQLHDAYGTVSGTVRNASTNAVIAGAEVTVAGKSVTTGLDGTYILSGLVTGSWPMSVVADGYSAFSKTTTVTAGATTPEPVNLTPLTTTVIYDTFTRADNTNLGTTEDSRHLPWIKSDPGSTAGIVSGRMSFDDGGSDGAALGGSVYPADFDLTANFSCFTSGFVGYAGFAYRAATKGVEDSGGYSVRIDTNSVMNIMTLRGHGADLATVELPYGVDFYVSPGPAIEIKVIGNRHRVLVNGVKYIDYTDTNIAARSTGGYINVFRNIDGVVLDNFNLSAWGSILGGSITGKVTSGASPVNGASVVISGVASTTTNSSGVYNLSDVPPGPQTVTASFPGLGSDQYVVTALANASVTQDFVLLPVALGTYTDTFTRSDSATPGVTEDASHTPWLKNSPDSPISISGSAMSFAAGGPVGYPSVGLQSISVKDFEAEFDMSSSSADGGWIGFRYRMPSQSSTANDVGFVFHAQPGTVYLWHVATGHIAAVPSTINWSVPHRVKLRVEGTSHKCWIDGSLIYDKTVEVETNSGFVALSRYAVAATFDNFTLAPIGVAPAPTPVASTRAAKDLGPGVDVALSGAIITGKMSGYAFYVEDANRSGGIKVLSAFAHSQIVGEMVKVIGKTSIQDGEAVITVASSGDVTSLPGGSVLGPLAVIGRSFVDPPVGLPVIGLFVKVAGNVTAVDAANQLITIDDGSGVTYRAWYAGTVTEGLLNDTVICTGCAGRLGGLPVIWLFNSTDLQIANAAP